MAHIHQLHHRHPDKPPKKDDSLTSSSADSGGSGGSGNGGTILSVVYVTASPTFTGAVGGYTTLAVGEPVQQTGTLSSHSAATRSEPKGLTLSSSSSSSAAAASSVSTSTITSAAATSAVSFVTSITRSSSSPVAGGPIAEGTTSSTAQASPSTAQTGMSAGGKTGLAIGIILAVAIVAAGVLFLYWRKKKTFEEEAEKSHNEKAAFGADAAPIAGSSPNLSPPPLTNTPSSAPTLDLRPMSRLMPEFIGQRRSQGNLLNTMKAPTAAAAVAATGGAASRSLTPPQEGSAWERHASPTNEKVENPFSDPTNPFGDEQAKAVSPSLDGPSTAALSASMPAPLNVPKAASGAAVPVVAATAAAPATTTAAEAAVAGAVVAAVAAAKPPGSPSSSHSTMSQGSMGAAAGSGAPPNNVHAVQLDFKPSMDDEIELRTGQLVRILHEYDDGWALCIRLDRSQQGVAPRTCLSAKPVKPRPMNNGPRHPGPRDPRGPPLGPNGRPMTPNGRPMTPNGRPPRPMSPARGPGSRPMTPIGSRPMTPNGRPPRPMSPARGLGSRPMTPTGGQGHRFNGPPSMSPAGGPRMRANSSAAPHPRPMSPSSAPFNQAPRPLSPGPIPGTPRALRPQAPRSMSPGPYGGGPRPGKMVAANQRRRSNSASALEVRERRNTPPGPSPLSGGAPPPGWVPRRPVGSDAVPPRP